MFSDNPSWKITGNSEIKSSFNVTVTVSVFTEELNEKPRLRQSNKFEKLVHNR